MYKSILENNINEIIDLYKSGKSCDEIAKHYNCSRSTINYQLKIRGISLRGKKGIKHCIHSRRKVHLDDFISKEGTAEFDYIIGILATDGNITRNMVRIEQADNNIEVLINFKKFLSSKVDIKKSKHRNRLYNIISFKNQDVCNYLSELGITPKKTFTLTLKYINWNVLLGVFDGDGCLKEDKRKKHSWRFSITSGSIYFIEQIKTFLESEGLHPLIYKEKNYYTISIGKLSEIYYIYKHLYKDSSYFLKRKYDKFCPLIAKVISLNSVNSVKERETIRLSQASPEEGAETLNGIPK